MYLSIPHRALADQLQIVAKAIPGKSTISSLEGVLFAGDGEKLTLTATNLEMGIQTQLPVPHQETGQVLLPAKIVEIIRRLPGEDVQITVNQDNYVTEIVSGQAQFQIFGLQAEEYPGFPQLDLREAVCSFTIKAADLRRALRQTLFAVSHDEGKPAFTGVRFTVEKKQLKLAASDTFRLATTSCPLAREAGQGEFLVPARNLQEAVRIFTDDEADIQAAVIKNQFFLQSAGINFSSRLLDENFPNVQRVIPSEFSGRAEVDTVELQQAVERASLLSEGANHVVHLNLEDNTMLINATSKFGKIKERLPVTLDGDGIEIALNSRFLLDMLKITEGEKCFIELTTPNKPCIFRDSLYENYLYLVLPIKV